MKRRLIFFIISVFVFLLAVQSAFAVWVPVNSNHPAPIEINLIRSDEESTLIQYRLMGFHLDEVEIEDGVYVHISVPEASLTDKRGHPELPKLNRNVMVPFSSTPALVIRSVVTEDYDLGPVAPSKGPIMRNVNPEDVPYTFSDFYRAAVVPDHVPVKTEKPFILRKVRGVNVGFEPMFYNPATGVTTVVKEALVEITTGGLRTQDMRMFLFDEPVHEGFEYIYNNRFLNYQELNTRVQPEHFIHEKEGVLVVTHPVFTQSLEPYIEWKTQKGFSINVVAVEKRQSEYHKIKDIIQDAFDRDRISHVVLVGDAQLMPYHAGSAGNAYGREADPVYGLVAGDDNYPDLFVSRMTAGTPGELDVIVNKILMYEKHPMIDDDWYSRAAGIASNEGFPSDAARAEILRKKLESWHYSYVDKIYEPTAIKADIVDALNQGRGFVNYLGHGTKTAWHTTRFFNSDIDALFNGLKMPFIVSVACLNGQFGRGVGDSFAERWLKAGTVNEPKGAIAVYASSTLQSWVPPTVGQKEITRLLINEEARTIGGLFINGVIAVLEDNSSTAVQTFQTWHIFGDSTLEVRTQKAEVIEAEMPEFIPAGTRVLPLMTPKDIRVSAVWNNEIIGIGRSIEDGVYKLSLKRYIPAGEDVLVTLTGFNKKPVQKIVGIRD